MGTFRGTGAVLQLIGGTVRKRRVRRLPAHLLRVREGNLADVGN